MCNHNKLPQTTTEALWITLDDSISRATVCNILHNIQSRKPHPSANATLKDL